MIHFTAVLPTLPIVSCLTPFLRGAERHFAPYIEHWGGGGVPHSPLPTLC